MKTVVIFDELEGDLQFFVFDGDIKHLDRVYINSDHDQKLIDELMDLIYEDDGDRKVEFLSEFPIEEVKNGAQVITAGFCP
jgi:hypothetical protein